MVRGIRLEDLIELELASCIQKLAYLRGEMTPRTFPADERDVIQSFGVACCERILIELERRAGREVYPLDEDTTPGWKSRRKKE